MNSTILYCIFIFLFLCCSINKMLGFVTDFTTADAIMTGSFLIAACIMKASDK